MYITGFFDILGTGLYFIGSYFFYRTLTCFLEPRRQFIRRAVSYFIGLCVCSVVIFPRDVVNITVTIPLFFAMLLIGFRQKILVKASVVLMFFPIIISFNFLIQARNVGSCRENRKTARCRSLRWVSQRRLENHEL